MKVEKPRTNIDGLHHVLEAVQERSGFKTSHGVKSFIANELGVTRQAINLWLDRDGVPQDHVSAVAKMSGLSPVEIRPESVTSCIPGSLFDQIAAGARAAKMSFGDHLIAVIKRGLKP